MATLSGKQVGVFSDVLHAAYAGILSTDAWSDIWGLMHGILPADVSGAVFYDLETGKPAQHMPRDVPPGFYDEFEAHYYAKDVVTAKALSMGLRTWRPTDVVSQRAWENSEVYADFLAHYNFHYSMSTMLGAQRELLGQVWIVRHGKPFADDELEILRLFQPHFTAALRQARLHREVSGVKAALQEGFDQILRPIFFFDDRADLVYMNASARNLCKDEKGSPNGLPVDIKKAASEFIKKHDCRLGPSESPMEIVCKLRDEEYRLAALFIQPPDSPRYCVVLAAEALNYLRVTLNMSLPAYGLSAREGEICTMLVKGLSNREIAEKLFISEMTVKDHVKSILEKLEVSRRSEVAAKLLGL